MRKATLNKIVSSDISSYMPDFHVKSIINKHMKYSASIRSFLRETTEKFPDFVITNEIKESYYIAKYAAFQWCLVTSANDDIERFRRKSLKALEESEFYR